LGIEDHEIEIEYQGETIGRYGVEIDNGIFHLTRTNTTCLDQTNVVFHHWTQLKKKQKLVAHQVVVAVNLENMTSKEFKYLFINKYRLFLFQKDGTKIKSNQIDRAGTLGIGKRL
jgi:hypothetical protein